MGIPIPDPKAKVFGSFYELFEAAENKIFPGFYIQSAERQQDGTWLGIWFNIPTNDQ